MSLVNVTGAGRRFRGRLSRRGRGVMATPLMQTAAADDEQFRHHILRCNIRRKDLGKMMRPFRRARKTEDLAFLAIFAGNFRVCATGLPGGQPPDRPIEVASDRYVSSRTCRACHPSQYASWHASYHRTMTQVGDTHSDRVELRRRAGEQPGADDARAARRRAVGRVRRSRWGRRSRRSVTGRPDRRMATPDRCRRCRTPSHKTPGGDDHGIAQSADLLVRDGTGARRSVNCRRSG